MNEKSSFSVWGVNKSIEGQPRQNFQPRMPNHRPRPSNQYQDMQISYDSNMMNVYNRNIRPNQDFVRPRFNNYQEIQMRPKNYQVQETYNNTRPRNLQSQDGFIRPKYNINQSYDQFNEFDGQERYGTRPKGFEVRPKLQYKRFDNGPVN